MILMTVHEDDLQLLWLQTVEADLVVNGSTVELLLLN